MSNVLQQRISRGQGKVLAEGWKPTRLIFISNQKTSVQFSNGKEAFGSCLRCYDTPCVSFLNEEVIPVNFERFPADRNLEVCASGAITKTDNGAPTINSELCILCGVCSSRCPVGAISLVSGKGARVEDSPNEAFLEVAVLDTEKNKSDRDLFKNLPTEGSQLLESDDTLADVFDRLRHSWSLVGDRFPNLISRNLLIGAGVGASIGRKGNNHMRMDIILSQMKQFYGVVEVEFGQEAVLDAPRDMMDALAVLVSRYGWPLKSTTPIIISDILPNLRSEYWHIIQYIANTLNVRIGTVTIFALLLCNWNRMKLDLNNAQLFYADRYTESYRLEILEVFMGRALHLTKSLRPQVDISK